MVNLIQAINRPKRRGGIAFLLFVIVAHCAGLAGPLGDSRWEWLYPWPSSYALMDMEFVNEHEGWIVGHSGTILHTTDGGSTWERQFSGSVAPLYTLEFIDDRHGWCAGGADEIWRTVDGGEHWTPVNVGLPLMNYYDIEFANENLGWAVGFSVWKTTDGGITWEEFPLPDNMAINDLEISPNGTLWAVADIRNNHAMKFLMSSQDSGATWQQKEFPQNMKPEALAILTDSIVWIGGWQSDYNAGALYRSLDRGSTWQAAILDSVGVVTEIRFDDSLHGWARGNPILATSDGGNTWNSLAVHDSSYVYAFDFASPLIGWASGPDGVFYKTTDGGETWTQLREHIDAVVSNIQNVGNDRIWALGSPNGGTIHDRGSVLRSIDGGRTWSGWRTTEFRSFRDLSMATQVVGFAVEFCNGLWATYDGGENWNRIATAPDSFAFSVYAASETNVFVLGKDSLIVTYDGCQTWHVMALPTDIPLYEIRAPLPGVLLAYGGEPVNEYESRGIILIRQGEAPWQVLSESDSLFFIDVQMTSENELWAIARSFWSYLFFHSADRGVTWETVDIDNWGIRSFKMLSDEIGIALDEHNRVSVTEDGWRTWSVDTTYFEDGVSNFTLVGNQLFGTTGNAIVKREVKPEALSRLSPIPENFLVSVYPNPFNSSLSVILDLPFNSNVDVSLYDVLGRRADEVFYGKLPSSTLSYSVPASLASGSYFIRATAFDKAAVKKVILMK